MSPQQKIILRDLGLLIHVPGLMAFVSLPIALVLDEGYAAQAFAWTGLIGLGLGQALYRLFPSPEETRLHHGMVVAALGWIVVPLLGALPFLLIANHLAVLPQTPGTVRVFQSPWNALFEAFSGFTGTGLTMALHPSQLPQSLQWWRSFSEWIGGVGVIVLMLSILQPTAGTYRLYYSEGREEKILPTVVSTIRTIWWIYILYTLLSILLLRLVGMPWWPALNHGMTGIATGGFGVADRSIGDYPSSVRLILVGIMLCGAISFRAHYYLLSRHRLAELWRDDQHRALWILVGLGTGALLLENRWSNGSPLWVDSLFQWTSALSTAGFQTVDLQTWSPTAKLLLSLAMLLGGAAGSTAGGIKMARVVVLLKGLFWSFQRVSLRPHELMRYRVNGRGIPAEEANSLVEAAGTLAVLWAISLWAGIFVLIHLVPPHFTLSEVILEVASAQGNVGLSTGITHPGLPWPGKLTLILVMWMGRLEIVPVFILLTSLLRRWQGGPA